MIQEYNSTEDKINISDVLDINQNTFFTENISYANGNAKIDFGNGNILDILGVPNGSIGPEQIIFGVYG